MQPMPVLRFSLILLALVSQSFAFGQRPELKLNLGCEPLELPALDHADKVTVATDPQGKLWLVAAENAGAGDLRLVHLRAGHKAEEQGLPSLFSEPAKGAELLGLRLVFGHGGEALLGAVFRRSGAQPVTEFWISRRKSGVAAWESAMRIASAPSLSLPDLKALHQGRWQLTWLEGARPEAAFPRRVLLGNALESVELPPVPALAGCGLSSALFPDGSELLVFRAPLDLALCDPVSLRRDGDTWAQVQRFGREGWKADANLEEPLRLAAQAPRASAAWYTAADGEPRILISSTPDAGLRWTAAARVDLGRPLGTPDLLMVEDASHFVLWEEAAGDDPSLQAGYYLRRYSSAGGTIAPFRLPQIAAGLKPRLLALSDSVLVALFVDKISGQPRAAYRLVLPSKAQLAELDSGCNCSGSSLPGFAIKGRVLEMHPKTSSLLLSHDAIPGLMRAGQLEVRVDAATFARLRENRRLLARVLRHAGGWDLQEVRVLSE